MSGTVHPSWATERPRPKRHRALISVLASIPSPALPESDPLAELPPVQRAVARLVAEGWQHKDIADVLGITEHTAKEHIVSAYKTLGLDGNPSAAARLLARMVGAWCGRCAGNGE